MLLSVSPFLTITRTLLKQLYVKSLIRLRGHFWHLGKNLIWKVNLNCIIQLTASVQRLHSTLLGYWNIQWKVLSSKTILCISQPPILEPQNKFFLFLGKNFLAKFIFYLRVFFQVCYGYTKNLSWNFFYLSFGPMYK